MPKPILTPLLLLALLGRHMPAFSQETFANGSLKLSSIATDKKYGYEADFAHSIKVGSPDNIIAYLNALRGPHGEKTSFNRVGSCCPYEMPGGPNNVGLLARWTVSYAGLAEPITCI